MINLYPWNTYIFYAAIVAVIITAISILPQMKGLLTALSSLGRQMETIEKNAETVSRKSQDFNNKLSKGIEDAKLVFTAFILLKAFTKEYKKEEVKGVNRIKKASQSVAMDQIRKNSFKILKALPKL